VPEATRTDLYEVTMAMAYLDLGLTGEATFSLFVRSLPPERGFLVAAGLESVLDMLERYHVDAHDAAVLAHALHRPAGDLAALRGTRFTGSVRAIPEGRIALANEPLLEVTAPLPQAQLVESMVLNRMSHQTAVASKAARCVIAAAGRPVVDFSLRRTHGAEAADQAARLGSLVGFAATSNVEAAHRYDLPATGTMAHSFIEAFEDERTAFRAFAASHPGPLTFLVDTYDTGSGTRHAADVLKETGRAAGAAIRLDSGDLGDLAVRARGILDGAGLPQVAIVASGGLDEYAIDTLVSRGAPIDTYAVGTKVGVSADAPYLDTAYKLVAYRGRPTMKLSTGKTTLPGPHQSWRRPGYADLTGTLGESEPPGGEPLLETVMRDGRRTGPRPSQAAAHRRFARDFAMLPAAARRVRSPDAPGTRLSPSLASLIDQVRERLVAQERDGHPPGGR
jgi:nicotinate phosphoribosyltransferase